MQPIFDLIAKKNPDHVRIRFYPSCTNNYTEADNKCSDLEMININGLSEKSIKSITKYLKNKPFVSGTVVEYGLKDTFVRISTIHGDDKSRVFFRRETHIIDNHAGAKDFGTYILELYKLCNEEDLPHIINYHHNVKQEVVTYTDTDLKICITKESSDDDTDQSRNNQWIDFNDDLNIESMTSEELTETINEFYKKSILLKEKLIQC